jgi:GNAT superfamily N-acetyltransferase
MVPEERVAPTSVDRLSPGDLVDTFAFLDRDPVLNVYLLALTLRDALAQPRDEYWAARRDEEIVALLHLGGQSGAVLPLGDDETGLRLLADQARARLSFLPRRFQVIGPRVATRTVVRHIARSGFSPWLERDQVYMALDPDQLQPFERVPDLSPARREDHAMVFESGARLRLEELGEDPRKADPAAYQKRVDEECRDGHTYLWRGEGGLIFRASVSAITADAFQISGVYTTPEHRNRGIARRALSELCTRLFERSRASCLFVNDFNAPAIAAYHRMGFVQKADWASAFYDTR